MRELVRNTEADFSAILTTVFGLMFAGGMQTEAIRVLSTSSLRLAEAESRRGQRDISGGLPLAALVLDAWHRDRRYLDAKGTPRAIRLVGPTPSVQALLRAEGSSSQDARNVAQRLKALRLVISTGRGFYKPASEVALVSKYDPFVLQYVGKSLALLLETIHGNLSASKTSEPLLERFAEVPDLPLEYVPAFQKFTKLHGWVLLRTVNDWLESRRARRTTRTRTGTARAGIHIHAYVSRVRATKTTAKVSRVRS
jgi:hypothetical protein